MKKIVIIGGSAAGAKAAAKARRVDQQAEITIVQKDPDLSMASCGYPYYVGGTFELRDSLLATAAGDIRDPGFFQANKNIKALVATECFRIDRDRQLVECRNLKTEETFSLSYDKLILCMGAKPNKIPVPGNDLNGVTHLMSMADSDYLHDAAASGDITNAVIIGGGLIGVEACEALRKRNINVTLIEMEDQVLTMLDGQLARLVENHMKQKGAHLRLASRLESFYGTAGQLRGVMLMDGTNLPCELAVVATGITPEVGLAREAALEIGELGGILVNSHMQTSDEHIYAAGDCIECKHKLTGKNVLAPMGDLANLQGRVAGENSVLGNSEKFPGTIRSAICKIFQFSAGVAGLTEKQAREAGIENIETVINASPDKPGFMGAGLLVSKILVDKATQRVLGYQCVGNGDVSRQVTTAAMAIMGNQCIEDLICADLPYAPPFSLAIDHFIASTHIMQNKLKGRLHTITADEVYERLINGKLPFMLDTRNHDEYEAVHLGIGETCIPLCDIRDQLEMLPSDKSEEIICFCMLSLRGYEAALVLESHGWTNVRVMEGGIMAWPYTREM